MRAVARLRFRRLLPLALVLTASTSLRAQETATTEDSSEAAVQTVQEVAEDPTAIDAQRQRLRQAFEETWSQWEPLAERLQNLMVEANTATLERRREIADELSETLPEYNRLTTQLREQTLELYRADPNNDDRVIELLKGYARSAIERDQINEAQQILDLLLEKEATAKGVFELAALAAYFDNRFDEAIKFRQKAINQNSLSSAIEQQLGDLEKLQTQWKAEAPLRERDDLPQVKLTTTQGEIILDLFEDQAPNTVANFISLVEQGFYDDLTFHRVISNFMAQAGCPIGNGTGGPGYSIACEWNRPDACKHFAGTLSMAHAGTNTGGSQFFLTFRPTPYLDELAAPHTVFGRVRSGMDVLRSLQRVTPNRPQQPVPDRILKAEVIRKTPGKDYTPVKMDAARD